MKRKTLKRKKAGAIATVNGALTTNQKSKISAVESSVERIMRSVSKQRSTVTHWKHADKYDDTVNTGGLHSHKTGQVVTAQNVLDYYLEQALGSLSQALAVLPDMTPARKKRVRQPGIIEGAIVRLKRGHDMFDNVDEHSQFSVLSMHQITESSRRVVRYAKITPLNEYDACKVPVRDLELVAGDV